MVVSHCGFSVLLMSSDGAQVLLLLFFNFFWYQGSNLQALAFQAGAVLLRCIPSPFCSLRVTGVGTQCLPTELHPRPF